MMTKCSVESIYRITRLSTETRKGSEGRTRLTSCVCVWSSRQGSRSGAGLISLRSSVSFDSKAAATEDDFLVWVYQVGTWLRDFSFPLGKCHLLCF
jgi:hypothetical protein